MQGDKLEGRIVAIMRGYEVEEEFFTKHRRVFPRRSSAYELIFEIRSLLFPGYFDDETAAGESTESLVGERLLRIERVLREQVKRALQFETLRRKTRIRRRGRS